MNGTQTFLVGGLPIIAALAVAVPHATAEPTCPYGVQSEPPGSETMYWVGNPFDLSSNYVSCVEPLVPNPPLPQMPATVPAGVTEASICADMRALKSTMGKHTTGDYAGGRDIHISVTNPELDKLTSGHVFGNDGGNTGNGMNMSYSDAADAVDAAVENVCPEMVDGIITNPRPWDRGH